MSHGTALVAQGPQHSHAGSVGSPPCLASRDGRAGHNLLLHIPAVLSLLPWHGWAAPSRAGPSHPPNPPNHSHIVPCPQPGRSVGIQMAGLRTPLTLCAAQPWPQLQSLLVQAAQPGSLGTRNDPGSASREPCWEKCSRAPPHRAILLVQDQQHLQHPPGWALRCGSRLGTAQPPQCCFLRSSGLSRCPCASWSPATSSSSPPGAAPHRGCSR